MSTNSFERAIARAIMCESTIRDVYEQLADLFSHVPELETVWRQMAEDEERHIDLLAEVRRHLSPEAQRSEAPRSLWDRIEEAEAYLEQARLDGVRTLDDAYELAHEMENYELVSLFQVLAVGDVPTELRDRFLSLQIDEHIGRLESVKDGFPSTADRNTISAHWSAIGGV